DQVKARYDLLMAGAKPEDIAQQKAAVKQASLTLANCQSELRRFEQLLTRGLAAGQQVEQARTRRDVAKAQLDAANQHLTEIKNGARKQERLDISAQLEAAKQHLNEVKAGPRPQEIKTQEYQVEIYRQQLAEAERGPRPQEVETAKAQLEVYRPQLAAMEAGPRPEEIRAAEAAVTEAQADVKTARAELDL